MTWLLKKIPKQLFAFWGNSQLPWLRYLTLKTFRHYNPDWTITIYKNENPTPGTGEIVADYWDKLNELNIKDISALNMEKEFGIDLSSQPSLGARDINRSDYLRWYLLHELGGLWADMDILFIRPMESMSWNSERVADVEAIGLPDPYNNFILSAPGSKLMAKLWEASRTITSDELRRDFLNTGPVNYQKVRREQKDKLFNIDFLQIPLRTTEIADEDGLNYSKNMELSIPEEAVGIHWHGSGYFGKYTEITPENYRYHESLIARMVTYAIEQMGK